MRRAASWTLSEASRVLGAPQHRLIHLCEKGVVRPAVQQARGRCSSRRFSRRNMLEFSVALKLRELMLPVSVAAAVVHVLGATEKAIARELPGFALPESLIGDGAPELRVVINDGQRLFFVLHTKGSASRMVGGVHLNSVRGSKAGGRVRRTISVKGSRIPEASFTPTADRERGRIEVSVTGLARDLSRALNDR